MERSLLLASRGCGTSWLSVPKLSLLPEHAKNTALLASRHCSAFQSLDLKNFFSTPFSYLSFLPRSQQSACPDCLWHFLYTSQVLQAFTGLKNSSQQGFQTAFAALFFWLRGHQFHLKNVYNLFIFVELRAISGTEHLTSMNGHSLPMS